MTLVLASMVQALALALRAALTIFSITVKLVHDIKLTLAVTACGFALRNSQLF